ncbi:LysR family transcriptional regulator [Streptomyces lasalocidi]
MDVQVLRCFVAVADGATVTQVAAEAHMTQPALSRALRRLEHEVGAELFQQVGRLLRLTPVGRAFRQHAGVALEQLDRGLRTVHETVSPESGLIPLAFLHSLGTWLLPPLITGFRERFPARASNCARSARACSSGTCWTEPPTCSSPPATPAIR